MTHSRLRSKALGACALALGLMAVWAGAAQAESTGGSWTYINAAGELKTFEGELAEPEISGELEKEKNVKGEEVVIPGVLHAKALEGTEVLYECKAFSAAAGSKLKANGVVLGKLVFTECIAKINGVQSEPCKPKEGKITTNLIKAQMLLHKLPEKEKIVVTHKVLIAEGETATEAATNFAAIESTASCALGIKVPVGGKFAIEPSNPTTHEVKHLIKEFSALTHLWILSDTVEHKANILNGAWAFLTGAHKGLKFAGLWL